MTGKLLWHKLKLSEINKQEHFDYSFTVAIPYRLMDDAARFIWGALVTYKMNAAIFNELQRRNILWPEVRITTNVHLFALVMRLPPQPDEQVLNFFINGELETLVDIKQRWCIDIEKNKYDR